MNKKQKIYIIKKLFTQYKGDQHLLIKLEHQNLYPSISYEETSHTIYPKEHYLLKQLHFKEEILRRIQIIENSESVIGEEYYHILLEDYYYEHKYWWKDFYSQSTYYRHQENAVNAFYDYLTSLL